MIKELKDNEDYSYPLLLELVLASTVIGFLVDSIDTVFGRVSLSPSDFRAEYSNYLIPFLGIIGPLIVFLYQKTDERTSEGISLVFAVGQSQEKEIPFILAPLVALATWLTHLSRDSARREGVAVQLGAVTAHGFSRLFDFENNSRLSLATDMAAGFAGFFQTPIAAVLFTSKTLVLGKLQLQALLPMTAVSFVADAASHSLGLEKFSHLVSTDLTLDVMILCKLAVLDIIFDLVGDLLAKLLTIAKEKAKDIMDSPYYRILLGGILLSLIFLICYHGRYSGSGTNLIEASFAGREAYLYDWLFKLLLTAATSAIGFQGDEVTPLFAIGTFLGIVSASLFGLLVEFVVAADYISVLSSAINTFIAPIFIGGEVFGFVSLSYFVVIMIFAYSANRKHSIYGRQEVLTF